MMTIHLSAKARRRRVNSALHSTGIMLHVRSAGWGKPVTSYIRHAKRVANRNRLWAKRGKR